MKHHVFYLSVIFVLAVFSLNSSASQVVQAMPGKVSISVPNQINYQGSIQVSGVPYNGTGYFKFVIKGPTGTENYWANDDTTSGEPVLAVPLVVRNGVFSVNLGDTTLDGMTSPIVTWVFNYTSCYLRIWFSATGTPGSFTLLTPDRLITSVPFAMIAEKAGDAESLGGYEASSYQQRISYPCPPGYAIYEVTEYGSVLCRMVESRPIYSENTLDAAGTAGHYNSITIGIDGLGLISYYDYGQSDLKVAHCEDVACSMALVSTLDSEGLTGVNTSIAIGPDGVGWISYYDYSLNAIKLAHCNDIACTSANVRMIGTTSVVEDFKTSSIAINTNGQILVSFIGNPALKLVRCLDTDCLTYQSSNIDCLQSSCMYDALAIGADGLPLIVYNKEGSLMVMHCDDQDCLEKTISTVDSSIEIDNMTSIAIGGDGLGLIVYRDTGLGLRVAHCDDLLCQTTTKTTLDEWYTGANNSLAIGPDGLGLITYYDQTNDNLKIAHCSNPACSAATINTLGVAGDVGSYSSITIGSDGLGLISYLDNGVLKVIHLANPLGVPWIRPR